MMYAHMYKTISEGKMLTIMLYLDIIWKTVDFKKLVI